MMLYKLFLFINRSNNPMTKPQKKTKQEQYTKYKLSRNKPNEIDIIHLEDPKVTREWFFENYIKPRKPTVIKYNPNSKKFKVNTSSFKPENILQTLKSNEDDEIDIDELLQVEELNNGGFGSGNRRLKMKLDEFLNRIEKGESLYLTTQYTENDPENCEDKDEENEDSAEEEEEEEDDDDDAGFANLNESDDEFTNDMHDDFEEEFGDEFDGEMDESVEPSKIYQSPLDRLLHNKLDHLPPHATEIVEPLIPQQINLWFGRTPSETEQLKIEKGSSGEILMNRGLPTKNSTSTGLHHDHADNLYVLVQGKKRFTLFSPDFAHHLYTTGDIRMIYDTGVIDYVRNEKAKNWTNVRADGGCIESENDEEKKCDSSDSDNEIKQDPPSFTKIPPALLHLDEADKSHLNHLETYSKANFPKFHEIKDSSAQVTLEDGDLLYLPAGWFHEVTSFGDDEKNNVHVALNYWFVPPDGESISRPYTDSVWNDDFESFKETYL